MVSLHVNLMSFPSNELLKFSLGTWNESYALANAVVAQMTLDEKLGVIIGTGQLNAARKLHLAIHIYVYWILHLRRSNAGRCVGDTYAIPRLGIPSICFQDGPAGVRLVKNVTGFPTEINAASTFSRRLMRQRGVALAEEFRGKGAQSVQHNAKSERRTDFYRRYAVFFWDLRWILCVTSLNYMLVLINPDCR